MLSCANDGRGRCVECAGKYPELECCKVKNGHFWNVYEFDGWQKSKNPSMAVASDARSYCPDCYKKEVGRAMRVAKGKHRKAASGLKPQARFRVRNIRELAAEAGLMVEGGSEDEFGGHDDEGKGGEDDEDGEDGEGGDSMADKGSDPTGVNDDVTPLHVTAIPVCSPSSHPVTTEVSHPAGSDWQTDTIATDLQTFFESLPDDHERAMMDSNDSDDLFLNLLS